MNYCIFTYRSFYSLFVEQKILESEKVQIPEDSTLRSKIMCTGLEMNNIYYIKQARNLLRDLYTRATSPTMYSLKGFIVHTLVVF